MAEVYGTAYYETARDKIVALLNTLKTAMAADDPTFSYVYDKHAIANLQLNGVSVAISVAETEATGWSGSTKAVLHLMTFTLRVHTAYAPYGIRDDQKNGRLMNSLINKMKQNANLGDQYILWDIDSISFNEEFSESESYGAEAMLYVKRAVVHTQD